MKKQINNTMSNLTKQIDFFEKNKSALVEKYNGKVIVISDSLDISPFPSLEEGYMFGVKNYGYGNFLLKECKKEQSQVQIITPIITLM
jgi:hypothetical protein